MALVPDKHGTLKVSSPAQLQRLRSHVSMVFQHFKLVQNFSVLENIAVGSHQQFAHRADALAHARGIAQQVGMAHQLDQPASELTVAGRKRLELARTLAIIDPALVAELSLPTNRFPGAGQSARR